MTTLFSLSAFVASLLGGLTCMSGLWILVTWNTRRAHKRRELITHKLELRENLYQEFVGACAMLLRDFVEDQMVAAGTLTSVIAIMNRIRVTASTPVLQAAESTLQNITRDYLVNEGLSMDEKVTQLRESALRGSDPLSDFSRACRDELWELHTPVG